MADVTRGSYASMDASTGMFAVQLTGLIAGEDLDAVAACYLKTSDGKVYLADGSANDELAEFIGFTPRAAKSGQPVTIYSLGARFRYGSGLSPGMPLYVSVNPGLLADAASTGGLEIVAFVINTTDIMCVSAFTG
jgi:hypothetical protein